MRAVKSVISAAGNLKRQNPDMNEVNDNNKNNERFYVKNNFCYF